MNNNVPNNFDSMTGQPINQPYNSQPPKQVKSNKFIGVIILIIIVGICVFGYIKFMKPINSENQSDNQNSTENTNQNNNQSNNNDTLDSNINFTNDKTGAFLMGIEDVFFLVGKGTVVTGTINRGTIKLGDTVQIIGMDKEIITTTVGGIEKFRQELDAAEFGENVAVFLKGVPYNQVERGQVLAKPNSIAAANKFEAEVYILSKEEGGRSTPFFNNYKPEFNFGTKNIDGKIILPTEIEMVMPGDNITLTVELVSSVAMEKGTEFSILEDGRTIGRGKITKIFD